MALWFGWGLRLTALSIFARTLGRWRVISMMTTSWQLCWTCLVLARTPLPPLLDMDCSPWPSTPKYKVSNLFQQCFFLHSWHFNGFTLFPYKFPDQVREELSRLIGSRQVRVEDRKNLPYTNAVIHEIQRLNILVPLVEHCATKDVTLEGFLIRKVQYLRMVPILREESRSST